MNKMIRLSKSGIEYLDYVWNFYSGCHHKKLGVCSVDNCWAKNIVNRFENHYPNGFEPTFYPEAFYSPLHLKKPSIIGCAFMGDLFGDWVDPHTKLESMLPSGVGSIGMSLKGWVFTTIRQCPQHRFLFLTKNPKQFVKWSPFPANCWAGVTATNRVMASETGFWLRNIEAKVKFVSFEPLLESIAVQFPGFISDDIQGIGWVIIGSQTKPYKPPKIEWVQEIVEAADKANIPIFLKENLRPLLPVSIPFYLPSFNVDAPTELGLRQEFPK